MAVPIWQRLMVSDMYPDYCSSKESSALPVHDYIAIPEDPSAGVEKQLNSFLPLSSSSTITLSQDLALAARSRQEGNTIDTHPQ